MLNEETLRKLSDAGFNTSVYNIIDSTKLSTYLKCPREFFHSYVLHWRPQQPNIHLEFGIAWHHAKERLLNSNLFEEGVADLAFSDFYNHYRRYFSPDDDLNNSPKDPGNAHEAIKSYILQYRATNTAMKVLYTEITGNITLPDDFEMTFKIDAIVEDSEGIWIWDHKTGSADSPVWDAQWTLSDQLFLYTLVAKCYFPPEKVKGAIIDGTILRKKGNLHKRLKIRYNPALEEAFLWNLLTHLHHLRQDYEQLASCDTKEDVLRAFPENHTSCTRYGICPYWEPLCTATSNPIKRHGLTPPPFFQHKIWNPHTADRDKMWKPKWVFDDGEIKRAGKEEEAVYNEAKEDLDNELTREQPEEINIL